MIELLGFSILLSMLVMHHFLWRRWRKLDVNGDADDVMYGRNFFLLCIAAALLIPIGALAAIGLQAWELSQNGSATWSESLAIAASTGAGVSALSRAVTGALLLLGGLALWKRVHRSCRFGAADALILLFLLVHAVLRARMSHAAASTFSPEFSIAVNAVHVAAKGIWIGGLVTFVILFLPILVRRDAQMQGLFSAWFGRTTIVCLLIGGVTGAYIAWLHLKSPLYLFATHWGMGLFSLLAFAILFLGLRLFQFFAVDPLWLQAARGSPSPEARETLRASWVALFGELFTGLAVLYLSSMLIITTPPVHRAMLAEQRVKSEGKTLLLGSHPTEDSTLLLTVLAPDVSTNPPTGIIVALTNEDEGIGPIVARTEERFPGGYVITGNQLTPPGRWRLEVTAQAQNSYDATATFRIQARLPVGVDSTRTFDSLAWGSLVVALLLLLLSILLWRRNTIFLQRMRKTMPGSERIITIVPRMAIIVSVFQIGLIIFLIWNFEDHGHGGFKYFCERNDGAWQESVPMREGKIMSSVAVLGCSFGEAESRYHLADEREYAQVQSR
jgi:putative copper export protein